MGAGFSQHFDGLEQGAQPRSNCDLESSAGARLYPIMTAGEDSCATLKTKCSVNGHDATHPGAFWVTLLRHEPAINSNWDFGRVGKA